MLYRELTLKLRREYFAMADIHNVAYNTGTRVV